MRRWLGLLCCASLTAGDIAQLRQLEEQDRIFELREALRRPGWNDSEIRFYQAVLESRFGREAPAVEDLRKFLATPAGPKVERRAYEELATALLRLGRYGDAAGAWAEALRRTPGRDKDRVGTENSRALYETLKDVAPVSVQRESDASLEAIHNPLGSWDVPVEVNGIRGQWIFDTGANVSTITESEAARLGLTARETNTYVSGSTGKKNPVRLAVASRLRLGGAQVSNVVLLVLPDKSLSISVLHYQIRGILGLPVLRALGSVGISAQGAVRIGGQEAGAAGEPNLFFAELEPIVEVRHGGRSLQVFLDTGANDTSLYPSFRSALTGAELNSLKGKREQSGGAGEIITRKVNVLPLLHLEILSRTLDLPNVSVLRKHPAGSKGRLDGVLGVDALAGGFRLDFRSMQLTLD